MPIEFEGETYTLQEIAQIGRKGPQLLVVNLSGFPQALKNVLKAIHDSGMGLNPQQDGTTLFIPVPKYSLIFACFDALKKYVSLQGNERVSRRPG